MNKCYLEADRKNQRLIELKEYKKTLDSPERKKTLENVQLRKQLYSIGNPIYGDQKYKLKNIDKGKNKNLMLHSYKIKFMINGIKYNYTALLPNYFKKLLTIKRLKLLNT